MTQQTTNEILEVFKQRPQEYQIEPFVLDFLEIWSYIHERAKGSSLDDILDILGDIRDSYTLPFYEKYKYETNVEFEEGWFKTFLSIVIRWRTRGGSLFPSDLIIYEICHNEKKSLETFVKRILSKEIKGDREALLDFLFPQIHNFLIPLDEVDIKLLKALQTLVRLTPSGFKEPSKIKVGEHLGMSTKTITRRLRKLSLFAMADQGSHVDRGSLGYETTLLIHSNPFPEEYKKYLLLSTDLTMGKFSIVQIPFKKPQVTAELHDQLEILVYRQMSRRISSWNLSQLVSGEESWRDPAPLLYVDTKASVIQPSPDLELSLIPPDKLFRPLTPADIKIIDFIVIKGSFETIGELSQAIKVSRPEISKRLQEYYKEKLLVTMYFYSKIGLDTTLFFFVSTEKDGQRWVQNLLAFPRIDVFVQDKDKPYTYFGYLKMPNKWLKPFARQVDRLRQDSEVKFYYKIASSVDFVRWGISLADTYE